MITFKCCQCFQPWKDVPLDFKTVVSDFMRLFSKFQPCVSNRIELDDLSVCRSCWIYFTRVHQLKHHLRLKNEICDANKSLLSSKIRRAQRSSAKRGNLAKCKEFEAQTYASQSNEDDDSDVGGESLDMEPEEAVSCSLNITVQSDNESPESFETVARNPTRGQISAEPDENSPQSGNAESSLPMAIIEDNPRCSPQSPCRMSSKTSVESETESVELYEVTDVITPTTESLSIAASSLEAEPVEATSVDTKESHSKSEPATRKTLVVSGTTSARLADEEPAESILGDTSDSSDSESEPEKSDEDPTEVMSVDASNSDSDPKSDESVKKLPKTSGSKRLPKKTKRTRRIRASNVKRLSETDFTYLNKYPFQRTDVGFKCGLCSALSNFCNRSSRTEYYMLKHIHDWHIRSDRIRSTKVKHRFIEIAPNRFQYGNYKVELIDANYRCEECGEFRAVSTGRSKTTNIMGNIRIRHENPARSHVCEFCGNVYRTLSGLSEHKKVKHTTSTLRFPCNDCDKTFMSRDKALTHHKYVHEGLYKKKFMCEICGKVFCQNDLLKDHVAFVHNGQKIKCKDCDKTFGSKMALRVHRHCHVGRKFICDICGMDFTQHYSVKRHKRTAHGQ